MSYQNDSWTICRCERKIKARKTAGGKRHGRKYIKKKLQKERPLRLQKLFLPTIPYDRINENNIWFSKNIDQGFTLEQRNNTIKHQYYTFRGALRLQNNFYAFVSLFFFFFISKCFIAENQNVDHAFALTSFSQWRSLRQRYIMNVINGRSKSGPEKLEIIFIAMSIISNFSGPDFERPFKCVWIKLAESS